MTPEVAARRAAGDAVELQAWRLEDAAVDVGWARFDDDGWEEAHLATPARRWRRGENELEATARDAIGEVVTREES